MPLIRVSHRPPRREFFVPLSPALAERKPLRRACISRLLQYPRVPAPLSRWAKQRPLSSSNCRANGAHREVSALRFQRAPTAAPTACGIHKRAGQESPGLEKPTRLENPQRRAYQWHNLRLVPLGSWNAPRGCGKVNLIPAHGQKVASPRAGEKSKQDEVAEVAVWLFGQRFEESRHFCFG